MNAWLEYLKVLWPVIATITGVVTPLLLILISLWLKSQFALRTETAELQREISSTRTELQLHDQRIATLEAENERPPTNAGLGDQIGRLAERIGALEAGSEATHRLLMTQNQYLQALVETGLRR